MLRTYSQKIPAQEALAKFRESIKRRLNIARKQYVVSQSRDTQKVKGASGEYTAANEMSRKALDKDLREPSELVFFPGGVYECTTNDPRGRFSQSQTAFMLELPTDDAVANFRSVNVWIAPVGGNHVTFSLEDLPTRATLSELGWNETAVGCASERDVNVRGGLVARRMQYALKHIGATTINKSMGSTLPYGIATEISKQYSPWEKGQIVVVLSRSLSPELTVIVGDADGTFAINKMWEVMTLSDMWTDYCKTILVATSIDGALPEPRQRIFDHPRVYPFRQSDASLPTDTTEFVYCLLSLPCLRKGRHKIYIGETECIAQRLKQHNSGSGALDTRDPSDRPWALVSYVCGLAHMRTRERMSLERTWQGEVQRQQHRGNDDVYSWITSGAYVVQTHNSGCAVEEDHIRFVPMVSPNAITEGDKGWIIG